MPPEESSYPSDWLRLADRDLRRVEKLLDAGDPEAAAFFLQQASEKLLKAFLLANGWQLQRTHDLEVLLNAVLAHDASVEPFRAACQRITAYYLIERYPLISGIQLTLEEVRRSMDQVLPLLEQLRGKLAAS
ncbi:MAG: HEPN domain-containing protein [Phycisphaerae bacterium]|nr:HEPN domain-containing protein [Phycisphaerae bacterium]